MVQGLDSTPPPPTEEDALLPGAFTQSFQPAPKTITVIPLVFIAYFCVSGGPYGLEQLASAGYPFYTVIFLIILPWFWSLPPALMTAELSSALPSNMGYILWCKTAFGPFLAFQCGFYRVVNQLFDSSLYPVMLHDYLVTLVLQNTGVNLDIFWMKMLVTSTVMLISIVLNIVGVEIVGKASVVFGIIILAPFAIMTGWELPRFSFKTLYSFAPYPVDWPVFISIMLWSMNGWDQLSNISANVRNPKRTFPVAMILAIALVIVTNAVPMAAALCIDHDWANWQEGYFPTVAAQIPGKLGTALSFTMLATACCSNFAQCLVSLCTAAESIAAMGHRELMGIKALTVRGRFKTPWVAVLTTGVIIGVLCALPFDSIIAVDIMLYCLGLALEFLAFLHLKFRRPDIERPYEFPGGKAGAVIGTIPVLIICGFTLVIADRLSQYVCAGVVVFAALLYLAIWYFRRHRRGPQELRVSFQSSPRSSVADPDAASPIMPRLDAPGGFGASAPAADPRRSFSDEIAISPRRRSELAGTTKIGSPIRGAFSPSRRDPNSRPSFAEGNYDDAGFEPPDPTDVDFISNPRLAKANAR